jgi:hypothetical protein
MGGVKPAWDRAGEGEGGGTGGETEGGDSAPGGTGAETGGEPPAGDGADQQGDTAGGETSGAADTSQIEYDFDLPDVLGVTAEMREEYENTLREAGVTSEQAQAIVAKEAEWAQQRIEQRQETLNGFQEAIEKDEFLSKDWDTTVKRMEAGLNAVNASDEFREFLQTDEGAMFAAHPDVIRAFAMLGQYTSDDTFELGGSTGDKAPDTASSWYGGTTPSKKGR